MKRTPLLLGAAAFAAAAGTALWLSRASQETAAATAVAGAARPAQTPERQAAERQARERQAPATQPQPPASLALPLPEAPPSPTTAEFQREEERAASPLPADPTDLTKLPLEELRNRATAEEAAAMEELARRLLQGVGIPKDQQAGAGWLLRAADHGSARAAFNAGVMYERGFVVERDPARAIGWYRTAVQAGDLPMAKYNLALMLRDGRGALRDGQDAADLLRGAARQGMAAAMFALGDLYDRGEAVVRDPAGALAWFAITTEFERQANRSESTLAKAAAQRVQTLRRTLLPSDLERAQEVGQNEFKQIIESLQAGKSTPPQASPPAPPATPPSTAPRGEAAPRADASPRADPPADPPDWPKTPDEQIRVIQQALADLKLLNDKPDGVLGPMTRTALRSFQKASGLAETGEPSKEVFVALRDAISRSSAVDLGQPEQPPAPPTSADFQVPVAKPN
ncbi:MAG: SEL1-like repeat protein [Alphaproteobacteria bacterium]|nr:SEL1-like repeat protein [Alphaproteobacteria bacterium]